jgi:energy-coupling factor transport system substrate-specific component
MKAAFTMWKNTRMIILAVVCAAIYGGARAALMIDFPILAPEVMGMGVANLLPMLFGLLFGPAGAWGAAIGHLIGDLGALTWKSLFDFVGIFLLGYLPYTMWTTLKPIADGQRDPAAKNGRSWMLYILIALIAAVASSVVVLTWLQVLGLLPYTVLLVILIFFSFISAFGSLIGGFLFLAVYGVIKKRLGLIWWDVMDEQDIGKPLAGTLGAWLVTAGALVGTAGTVVGFGGAPVGQAIGIIGMVLVIVGSILM